MKNYFRRQPPSDLILKAVKSLGLESLDDPSWTHPKMAKPELQAEVIEEVREYYYPVFAKKFLDNVDASRYITIVRHLLRTIKRGITRKDACESVAKKTYVYFGRYSLTNTNPQASPTVSFTE